MKASCGIEIDYNNIDMSEFTKNVTTDTTEYTVSGEGIFDILMSTATKHLKAQFDGTRIKEEDYAVAYVQLYQANLQTAKEIWLQKGLAEIQAMVALEEICMKREQVKLLLEQLKLLEKQAESEEMKKALYLRQIEGFDEDYKHKILKVCLDSWTVGFSVARDDFLAKGTPVAMTKAVLDELYNLFIVPELDRYIYPRPSGVEPMPDPTTP